MKKEFKIQTCQFKCGVLVYWEVCDDDGENCTLAKIAQCGHCGMLNSLFTS